MAEFKFKPEKIRNYGCGGGRQDWTWDFMKKHGGMWDEDYRPYESGSTFLEGDCEHDKKNLAVKVKDWFQVYQDAHAIKRELRIAPLSVAIGAGSKLYGYKSGVIE